MAAVVPFLPMIFSAVGAIGTAVSAVAQGERDSQMSTYNAQLAQRNAGIARDQAAADADAQARHARRVIGGARAAYGASGITMEGSPLDVLEMSAANAELDNRSILYKGELRAMGYEDTAGLDLMRGDAARQTGGERAGSAILLGAGRAYGQMPAPKPKAQSGYSVGDYGAYDYSFDGLN